MIESSIYSVLSSTAAITTLLGTRPTGDSGVYPLTLPIDPVLPAIAYKIVANVGKPTMSTRGKYKARVQIDCFGNAFADATNLRNAVIQTLQGYSDVNFSSLVLSTGADVFDHELLQYIAPVEIYAFYSL